MEKTIAPLTLILHLNERLFLHSLEGITTGQAMERISNHNNPLIWIATHTVWARYNMATFLGQEVSNPFNSLFKNFKAYDVADSYPSLEVIKSEWNNASNVLKEALATVTEEHLLKESPIKSPIGDFTNAGTMAFLVQHESYDIGQLAFLKKYYTKEAMKY